MSRLLIKLKDVRHIYKCSKNPCSCYEKISKLPEVKLIEFKMYRNCYEAWKIHNIVSSKKLS